MSSDRDGWAPSRLSSRKSKRLANLLIVVWLVSISSPHHSVTWFASQ